AVTSVRAASAGAAEAAPPLGGASALRGAATGAQATVSRNRRANARVHDTRRNGCLLSPRIIAGERRSSRRGNQLMHLPLNWNGDQLDLHEGVVVRNAALRIGHPGAH